MIHDPAQAVVESVLPEDERLRFLELCRARPAEQLKEDATRVEAHLRIIELGARNSAVLNVDLARSIANTLIALIASADSYTFQERRLLSGAIEYFVAKGDLADDYAEPRGLDDDARVTRAVCRFLDRSDLANSW
jgi:hypothetical protein